MTLLLKHFLTNTTNSQILLFKSSTVVSLQQTKKGLFLRFLLGSLFNPFWIVKRDDKLKDLDGTQLPL